MKTLIFLLALLSLPLAAVPVKFAWDEPPAAQGVTSFNLYDQAGKKLASPLANNAAVEIADTVTSVTVSAVNIRGEGPKSAPLALPALPPAYTAIVTANASGELVIRIQLAATPAK